MSCRVIAVWQGPVLQLFAFFSELFIFAGYLTSVANAALHY
jgi:hypothetical protein